MIAHTFFLFLGVTAFTLLQSNAAVQNELCVTDSWSVIKGTWEMDSANCTFENTDFGSGNVVWLGSSDGLTPDPNFEHESFILTVNMSLPYGYTRNPGFLIRAQSVGYTNDAGEQYYIGMSIGAQAFFLGRMNDSWSQIELTSLSVTNDTIYSIVVVANGTDYNFYVDGNFMFSSELTGYTTGSIGLRTFGNPAKYYAVTYQSLDFISSAPTTLPSNQPSHSPSQVPTSGPTTGPSHLPTQAPSYAAVAAETVGDENDSGSGSSSLTLSYQSIDSSDIDFVSMQSTSFPHGYFNPGYKNTLHSVIEIKLDTVEKINLFRSWAESPTDGSNMFGNISLTLEWIVEDVTDSDNILSVSLDADVADILEYNEASLQIINNSSATYSIDSYFVLYSSTSVNKYSGLSICNAFDDTYFTSARTYRFSNLISFVWTYDNKTYSAEKEESFASIANSLPSGGHCKISPETGTALVDYFNVSCSGWTHDTSDLEFNFIKDETNSFLKTFYSSSTFVETVLSSGYQNITAVVIDEYDLATCVSLAVFVDKNVSQLSESPRNYTIWVTETYQNLLDSIETSTGSNVSQNSSEFSASTLASVLNVLEAAYEVTTDYVDTNSLETEEIASAGMIALHEDLISVVVEYTASESVDTEAEVTSILSTFAEISAPLVDVQVDETENVFYYEPETPTNILDVVANDAVSTLSKLYKTSDGTSASSSSLSSQVAEEVIEIVSNVQEMRFLTAETDNLAKENGQTVVSSTIEVCSLVLLNGVVGETYTLESDSFKVKTGKISNSNFDSCGGSIGGMTLAMSQELVETRSESGKNHLDCTMMQTPYNIYGNHTSDEFANNFALIDVTSDSENESENESENDTTWLSRCDPVLIEYDESKDYLKKEQKNYPTCVYYNESLKQYDSAGCYVVSWNESKIVCACVHTTFFGLSGEDFVPQINVLTTEELADIDANSLYKHPLGWIVCASWIFVCVLIMLTFQKGCCEKYGVMSRIEDRPLIAQKGALFADYNIHQKENKNKYYSILEWKIFKYDVQEKASNWLKFWHLYKLRLKNDHIWFGLCCRDYGTSYTCAQRTSVLMLRLLTTSAVAALFYGTSTDSDIGDVSVTMYESLFGFIPMYILIKLVKGRKPKQKELDDAAISAKIVELGQLQKKAEPSVSVSEKTLKTRKTLVLFKDLETLHSGETAPPAGEGLDTSVKLAVTNREEPGSQAKAKSLVQTKMDLLDEIRVRIYNNTFKFPYYCKYFTMCIIIVWALGCSAITTIFCVWFDYQVTAENSYEADIVSDCPDTGYDVSLQTWMNYDVTEAEVRLIDGSSVSKYEPPERDSFGENVSVSSRFLLSVMMSYMLSVFFWEPLMIMLKTAYTLRKYSKQEEEEIVHEGRLYYEADKLVRFQSMALAKKRSESQGSEIEIKYNDSVSDLAPAQRSNERLDTVTKK